MASSSHRRGGAGPSPAEDHSAERDRLRAECSTLFDRKIAIEAQLYEIQNRLRWLDDAIDGAGVDAAAAHAGGEEGEGDGYDEVDRYDEVDGGPPPPSGAGGGGGRRRRGKVSTTLPDDYLADPHAQPPPPPPPEADPDARRISTSPPPPTTTTTTASGTLHSKTPPGLRPSVAAPAATRTDRAPGGGFGAGEERGNDTADPVNPFGDLWGPNEGVASDHRSSVGGGNKRRRGGADVVAGGGGGANTLEKYFAGVGPPPSDAPSAAVAAAAAARGGAVTSARGDVGTPPRSPPRRRPRGDVMMRRLRGTFGISEFRDHQGGIIDATMRGEDAFVVMRTGGGKSLTYQLPAVLECFECGPGRPRKVTVVVSPLVSLIRDQEEQMNRMIPGSAVSFTSAMAGGTSEHARRWGMVRDPNGGVALIFVTPEKVGQSTKFKGEMEKLHHQGRLGRFVIDEW
jgi:hypothetical protein